MVGIILGITRAVIKHYITAAGAVFKDYITAVNMIKCDVCNIRLQQQWRKKTPSTKWRTAQKCLANHLQLYAEHCLESVIFRAAGTGVRPPPPPKKKIKTSVGAAQAGQCPALLPVCPPPNKKNHTVCPPSTLDTDRSELYIKSAGLFFLNLRPLQE